MTTPRDYRSGVEAVSRGLVIRGPSATRAILTRIAPLWRFAQQNPLGAVGGLILLFMIFVAIFAPMIAPNDPLSISAQERLEAPSLSHWFGTDDFGRDVLSRIIFGARISVTIGFSVVALSTIKGTLIGIVSGYYGGKLDLGLQRLVDAMVALPFLVILLAVLSVLGPSMLNIILVLGLLGGFAGSRVIRGATMSAKENQYVEAARSMGCSTPRILLRHILPNVSAPIMVIATVSLGSAILAEASLGFLGVGIQAPAISWGAMLNIEGIQFLQKQPWLALFPGLAITLGVFGANMLGDGLRDFFDPRLRGRI